MKNDQISLQQMQQEYLFAKEHLKIIKNLSLNEREELIELAKRDNKQEWIISLFTDKLEVLEDFVATCEDMGIHLTIRKAD